MILRVRSRDGLERVTVPDAATVGALAAAIREQLNLATDQPVVVSKDQGLLLAKDDAASVSYSDMRDPEVPLRELRLKHGDIVFLWYTLERTVKGPKVEVVPAGVFGRKMTVEDMVLRQIRIERQDKPHCQTLSFDHGAADQFQRYVSETLGFSIQRGGFMYGTCDEDGEVQVDFIYEPPQTGTESSLLLHRNKDEERCVDAIAAGVGMRRVGFIFTRSAAQSGEEEKDYTLSAAELRLAAELHAEALNLRLKKLPDSDEAMADANGAGSANASGNGGGEGGAAEGGEGEEGFKQFAIGVVQLQPDEEGVGSVHFEAFQLSDQCVKLFADGLFADPEDQPGSSGADRKGKGPEKSKDGKGGKDGKEEEEEEEGKGPGVTRMRKEVIVARKDTFVVDNDFFLLTVSIKSHEGPLGCTFPVENRMIMATDKDLRAHLEKTRSLTPYSRRLADFHLLLFLSNILDPRTDLPVIAEAVRLQGPVPEGYQLILESF